MTSTVAPTTIVTSTVARTSLQVQTTISMVQPSVSTTAPAQSISIPRSPDTASPASSSTGMIVGVAVGGVLAVGILGGVAYVAIHWGGVPTAGLAARMHPQGVVYMRIDRQA